MKKLFIDCEFTDLIPDNKLISIALVTEDGDRFYAELTDTYERAECSDFVMNFVLPYLKGGEYKMTESECALKIANWIELQEDDFILACDNVSWDKPHLDRLLNKTGAWPINLTKNEYFKFVILDNDFNQIMEDNNLIIHNALDDATAMSIAYKIGCMFEI